MVKKLTFASIGALFLSFPVVLAAGHTVSGDLTAFFEAFRCLFRLQSSCVANNLVIAAPLIGLIVVIFGLTYFIAVSTIFKDKEHHKYAQMIAIGISILGIAQQSVYNAVLSWSSLFLMASFITVVIFMFIIFLNHSKKNYYGVAKDMREAHAADMVARKQLYKIKHDVAMDTKFYDKVTKDIDKLSGDLDEIISLAGSEKSQVDELTRLLQQLASAAQKGEQGLVHQYAQALANHVGALISSMKHEDVLDTNVNVLVEKINSVLSHWSHDEMKDENIEKQMLRIFRRVSAHLGHDYDEKEYTKLMAENKLLADHFKQMHHIIHELASLRDHLTSQTEQLDNLGYKKKHLEASELRDAVFDGNYAQAHKHLDELRSIIEQEPNVANGLNASSSKIRTLVSQLDQHQTAVLKLSRDEILILKEKMRKDSKLAKESDGIHRKYGEKIKLLLVRSALDCQKYAKHAKQVVVDVRTATGSRRQAESHIDKKVFDLPERLLYDFSSLKTKLSHFSDEVAKLIKDKKSSKSYIDEALTYLDSMGSVVESSKNTLSGVSRGSHSEYNDVLDAITHLLAESEKLVGHSNGSVLRDLKQIKEDYSKAIKDFEEKKENKN